MLATFSPDTNISLSSVHACFSAPCSYIYWLYCMRLFITPKRQALFEKKGCRLRGCWKKGEGILQNKSGRLYWSITGLSYLTQTLNISVRATVPQPSLVPFVPGLWQNWTGLILNIWCKWNTSGTAWGYFFTFATVIVLDCRIKSFSSNLAQNLDRRLSCLRFVVFFRSESPIKQM